MIFTSEELEQVEQMAGVNFSPEKIADFFNEDRKQFMSIWYDKTSDLRQSYDRGKLRVEFELKNKQVDNARGGNITAYQTWEKSKNQQALEDLKQQIFFGGYES